MRLRLVGAVFGLLGASALLLGYYAARWLKQDDPPRQADAIVVLAGRFERSMHAADLFRAGYAPEVAVSEAVPDSTAGQLAALGIRLPPTLEIHRRILVAKGVPAGRIQALGPPAISTSDEAQTIAARYGRRGKRVLVVTSPSHVMRARLIIEHALRGRGVELAVCATPYESFPDDWWRTQEAARDVLLEWAKILFYVGGGRFRAASPA